MYSYQHRLFLGVLCIGGSLLICTGCDDKVKLSGRVTFFDDGSPLNVGCVYFVSDTYMSRGQLQSDGTFVLSSTGKKDGIPAGQYGVYIGQAEVHSGQMTPDDYPVMKSLIAEKFTDSRTSGLSLTVDRSTRQFDIVVDRP